MIPVRDNSGSFHGIVAVYDSSGREIAEVRDNQGRLLFKNWNELSGIPPLHFTSRGEHLLDYRIYGNTVQDGIPAPETPAEVQGVGERTENLFDKSTAILGKTIDSVTGEIKDSTIGRFLSDYIKINKNDTFLIINGNDNDYFWLYDVDKKYTSRYVNKYWFTASEDGYIRMSNNADINMVMVVKFTRPDHYIPYGYKIPVTVGGVNLFDYNWLWTKENVKLNDYFNYITIAMKPNTEYTISNNYRVNKTTSVYETALIVVNSETAISTANGGVDRVKTVTTASDGLLRIAYRTAIANLYYQDIVVNRDTLADGTYYIQINEGSSASPYEPYHEPITTPVYVGSEPLHKIGDYADYVDFKRGVIVRGIKKLVLTGEERVQQDGVSGTVYVQLTTISATIQVGCTHFMSTPTIPRILIDRIDYAFIGLDLQRLYFGTRLSTDDFKTYLTEQYSAGTPVTIWYVLATPEEEPLENLLPIQTIKGSDVLTVDTTVQPSNIWIKGKIKAIN